MCSKTEQSCVKKMFIWLLFAAILSSTVTLILSMWGKNRMMNTSKPLYRIDIDSRMNVELDFCGHESHRLTMPVSSLSIYGGKDYMLKYMLESGVSREWGCGLACAWGTFPNSITQQVARLLGSRPRGNTHVTYWYKDYKVVKLVTEDDGTCKLRDSALFAILHYTMTNVDYYAEKQRD